MAGYKLKENNMKEDITAVTLFGMMVLAFCFV
jgi:hypothetical protein